MDCAFHSRCRRNGGSSENVTLTRSELGKAELQHIKASQREYFADKLLSLQTDKSIPKCSSLLPLFLFLDSDDVLRVGKSISKSKLSPSAIHPIILLGKVHSPLLGQSTSGYYMPGQCFFPVVVWMLSHHRWSQTSQVHYLSSCKCKALAGNSLERE